MSSIYKRLNWGDKELITGGKLNDMVGNDDWLYENMITGFYQNAGIQRNTGLSLRTGYAKMQNSKDMYVSTAVYYTQPFTPGARPVIVDGFACDIYFGIMKTIRGLDNSAFPDHRGFIAYLYDASKAFAGGAGSFRGNQFVGYIAIAPTA